MQMLQMNNFVLIQMVCGMLLYTNEYNVFSPLYRVLHNDIMFSTFFFYLTFFLEKMTFNEINVVIVIYVHDSKLI